MVLSTLLFNDWKYWFIELLNAAKEEIKIEIR